MNNMEDQQATEQRSSTICLGCFNDKSIGLVVCWDCFKNDSTRPAYKYFMGTFSEWLAQGVEEPEADHEYLF